MGHIPTRALTASEAAHEVWEPRTLVVAMSQSGETADVLRALDGLPSGHGTVLALTNNAASVVGRRADAVIDCLAGPEIGVAATKTFVAQVLTGACVALSDCPHRGARMPPPSTPTSSPWPRHPTPFRAPCTPGVIEPPISPPIW